MTVYFVSGHENLTQSEFDKFYKPQFLNTTPEDAFLVCDAKGCDTSAQAYLSNPKRNVTVCHMGAQPRINLGNFATAGNFETELTLDVTMTIQSRRDICWVRPGFKSRELSRPERNKQRRQLIK